jgi:hypothetical protein
MNTLSLSNYKRVLELFTMDKIDEQKEAVEMQIKGLKRDLKNNLRAKNRLLELLKEDHFDKNRFLEMDRSNAEEMIKLQDKLTEAKNQLVTIDETRNQYKAIESFAKDKKFRRSLHEQFKAFDADDKKRLFEGLIDGQITVNWEDVTVADLLEEFEKWTPELGEVVDTNLRVDFKF